MPRPVVPLMTTTIIRAVRLSSTTTSINGPTKSTTIQVLGILGLVFFWMPLVCLILSITALTMANEDLRLMQRGHMDRAGQGATTAGRTCAIISLVLMPCTILCCCMSRMR